MLLWLQNELREQVMSPESVLKIKPKSGVVDLGKKVSLPDLCSLLLISASDQQLEATLVSTSITQISEQTVQVALWVMSTPGLDKEQE